MPIVPVPITCTVCNTTIQIAANRIGQAKFCGRVCMGKHKRATYAASAQYRFNALLNKTESCWLWLGNVCPFTGYGKFHIRRYDGSKEIWAHRASWQLHFGPIPASLNVLHRCDVHSCVRPSHLFIGTQADNVADMVAKGRSRLGENSGSAKLSESDVIAIRERRAAGESVLDLGEIFGVSHAHITGITRGRFWTRTPGPITTKHFRVSFRAGKNPATRAAKIPSRT